MRFYLAIGRRAPQIVSACVASWAALVLIGWAIRSDRLTGISPTLVRMNPLTAVLFLLAAAALAAGAPRRTSQARGVFSIVCAAFIVTAGISILAVYTGLLRVEPDQLLFHGSLGGNRMAPNTALQFVFAGLALIMLRLRGPIGRTVHHAMALVTLGGGALTYIGYAFSEPSLYGVKNAIPMALNTAVLFLMLAAGMLLSRPERGLARIVLAPGSGGMVARRLIVPAVILPIAIGFLRIQGQRAGYYGTEFGAALFTTCSVLIVLGAIVITASRLNQLDHQRRRAATELTLAWAAVKQLNDQLEFKVCERTAELEEANRDLRQKTEENEMFVYGVSHDLRSPLVNLQGFSKELTRASNELVQLLSSESIPASVREAGRAIVQDDLHPSVRFIGSAVMRLSGIIDALLRLSRAGRVEFQRRLIDMNETIARLVESASPNLYDGSVELRIGNLPPCYGDPTAVEQVFSNLLGNALKYLDPQRPGCIEIGVQISDVEPSDDPTYFVRDNGLGIPSAHHEKIFQPFKRFHPQAASGDGMGLAIVQTIVTRHGGRVWVESEEGRGSTFFVRWPTKSARPSETTAVAIQQRGGLECNSSRS